MNRKQYLETVLEKSFKELKIIENSTSNIGELIKEILGLYEKIKETKGKNLKIIELCIKSINRVPKVERNLRCRQKRILI